MNRRNTVSFLTALVLGAGLTLGSGRAQERSGEARTIAVLELFTSQGCSSCPPADALFAKLAQEKGLVVISYPVEIWDYLGWKDTLAQPAFTQRQKQYGYARGDRQVYTPQAVINGAAHAVGSDFHAIDAARRATQTSGALAAPLVLRRDGSGYQVVLPTGLQKGSVWLVTYRRHQTVPIGRGENSGRQITYSNVAQSIIRLAEYSGEAGVLALPAPLVSDAEQGFAVLLQAGGEKRPGLVLAAIDAPRQ